MVEDEQGFSTRVSNVRTIPKATILLPYLGLGLSLSHGDFTTSTTP